VYDGGGTGKGSVTAYRPGATGDARPELLITAGVDNPGSIAFDPSGDLWVPNSTSNTVVEYSRAELSKASPVPTVTIGDNGQPWADAFDPSGDLWVYNDSGTVVEFTKAQLAKSGSPQPAVTLGNGVSLIAFDSSGDLWEGDGAHVFEWAKAQLTKSGAPAPRVNIFSSSLQSVFQPTFDSSGDLWVTNYPGRTVVEFTKAQLAKSGSLNAKVTISSEPASEGLDYPGDVGFDLTGDLWVPNAGHNAVIEFAKSQLAKSGSQRPAKVIAGTATGLNWPWSVAVEP
jgi:DNA-binding beta-propeller fold protein YncE